MFRTVLIFLIVLLFAGVEDSFAGRKEIYNPIIDVPNYQISTSKKIVKEAIQHQFSDSEIEEETEDSLKFKFVIRVHTANIIVHFTETSIEFEFLSSVNLDYKIKKDKQFIHKNYNVWMRGLEEEINTELSKSGSYIDQLPADSYELSSKQGAKGFEPTPTVMEGETEIYVIRKKAMTGAARKISVHVNDRLSAILKSGSYCMVKAKAGPLVVDILQDNEPFAYLSVNGHPGESVYLWIDYVRGTLTEVSQSLGLQYVNKYKKIPTR